MWAVQHIADDAEVSKYETDEKYLQYTGKNIHIEIKFNKYL